MTISIAKTLIFPLALLSVLLFSKSPASAQWPNYGQNIVTSTGSGTTMKWLTGTLMDKLNTAITANHWNKTIPTGQNITGNANILYIKFDNEGNSAITPYVTYSCGSYAPGKADRSILASGDDEAWPDSVKLYYAALKHVLPGSDLQMQLAIDTMRLYVSSHPYATTLAGQTLTAIRNLGGFVRELARREDSRNEKIQYNWLVDAQLWNDDPRYQEQIIGQLATMLGAMHDLNGAANMWYNYTLIFPDSGHMKLGWEGIQQERYAQSLSRPPQDTLPFYKLTFPLKKIDVPPLAVRGSKALAQTTLEVYPNPSTELVGIDYVLSAGGGVRLDVSDLLGRTVRTIVEGPRPAGANRETFSVSDLPSGHYFVRLQSATGIFTQDLVVEH